MTHFFAAFDFDCDFNSTTFYMVEAPSRDAGITKIVEAQSYFGRDDIFSTDSATVLAARTNGTSTHGDRPRYFDHGPYKSFSVKGTDWVAA